MKHIRKYVKGASLALASVVLTASTTPVLETTSETPSPADIYFDESMQEGKFITVVNDADQVIYDGFVKDAAKIKNPKLRKLLNDSDFLMSTRVSDYYLIQD